MRDIYYIYKIVHTPTGRTYVGLSRDVGARWKQHRSCAAFLDHPLYEAMRECDPEEFAWEIIDQVDGPRAAHALEARYMEELNSFVPAGFNKRPHRSVKAPLQVRVERTINNILSTRRSHAYSPTQIRDISGVVANAIAREMNR